MASALFVGEAFAPAQQLGVDLREFLQTLPKLPAGCNALPALLLPGRRFEKELQDTTGPQPAGQIIKRAMLAAPRSGAIGLAASGEAFDIGSAQEMGRNSQLAQERDFAPGAAPEWTCGGNCKP
ncbi:MAG TPA: hypothetical protein VH595_21840 [Verrucomicrobiae bacterium]|nr:hypothetical protein [Verrucomicrobiae bacterium]